MSYQYRDKDDDMRGGRGGRDGGMGGGMGGRDGGMGGGRGGDGPGMGGEGDPFGLRRRGGKRKVCRFCADSEVAIDYKDANQLKYFISDRGKIVPRRISGNCALHQRAITTAIKRARNIALMPFTSGS
jgi:small subunit ribosomal protein S18